MRGSQNRSANAKEFSIKAIEARLDQVLDGVGNWVRATAIVVSVTTKMRIGSSM